MRLPAHEATTAALGALLPSLPSEVPASARVLIGRERSGALYCFDPFDLYANGELTNPNVVVFGQIGRGKSAFVKTFLYREAAFGRRIVVFDPKGEYAGLARALGAEPLRLGPGLPSSLNPLEGLAARGGRLDALGVVAAIGAAALGRPLTAGEHLALDIALGQGARGGGHLGNVVDALLEPDPSAASAARCTSDQLRLDGRTLALELRRFVHGDLAGVFGERTTPGIDLASRVLVVDLSALYRSTALGAVLVCVQAALEATLRAGSHEPTIVAIDEAWALLANLGAARFLQSSFKLARAFGVANLLVLHRPSDLAGAGEEGSLAVRLADGLVSDAETLVCYAQPEREAALCEQALGFSERERRLLPGLRRGIALWHVGGRRALVEHRLARGEAAFVDTDAALRRGAQLPERATRASAAPAAAAPTVEASTT